MMDLPPDIQFAPPGRHWTTPSGVSGASGLRYYRVEPSWATILNKWLSLAVSAAEDGLLPFPFADFGHHGSLDHCLGEAAFWPEGFFWGGQGSNGGVRVKARWNEPLRK